MLQEILDAATGAGHLPRGRGAGRASAEPLRNATLRGGDSLLLEPRSGYVYERIPKAEGRRSDLEEVPDITYAEIAAWRPRSSRSATPSSFPTCTPTCSRSHHLRPPKGVLLYAAALRQDAHRQGRRQLAGQEGGGQDGRAGAEGQELLPQHQGPELLTSTSARPSGTSGWSSSGPARRPARAGLVIVFFNEMDSIFRTGGRGVQDVENTIVPQLLSEIDGVEGLENVIVIGASNREDMIDPAILRPGRLDVKIKIERPDAEAARDIFSSTS